MKLKCMHWVALAAFLSGGFLSANAQLGVYGTISAERLSGVACQSAPLPCAYSDGVDRAIGGGGGVYYDWLRLGPAKLGLDLRGDILKSNKSASFDYSGDNALHINSVLAGARASFSARKDFLHPYGEVLFGWNRRNGLTRTDPNDNFFAYRVVGGLDINVMSVMAVRVPEVTVGQNIGTSGVKSNTVESVSVGVVFHMPNRR